MSTSKKPATNAGTANRPGTGSTALANRQQYVDLEQQRIAQAYIGRVVSDHFSTGAESMTSRDFISMFGAAGMGGIGTITTAPTPASTGNPSKSHHKKATPAQQAALARARAAKAGAKK
jgi:hypothetical protein